MAIIKEFQAHIYVDGVQANEFEDEDEEATHSNKIAKYVKAQSGAFFEVKCLVDHSYNFPYEGALCCDVYLDGVWRAGVLLTKDGFMRDQFDGTPSEVLISGTHSLAKGVPMLYKFQFADLETRDLTTQDDVSTFKKQYGDLGTIVVRIGRTEVLSETSMSATDPEIFKAVPEKALKGRPLDVATKFTPTAVSYRPKTHRTKNIEALVKFKFKYRTRRALQAEMIVERSPTPLSLEERPVEELTREEMAELIRRQRVQLPVIKDENKLKRERSSTVTNKRPLKSSKGNSGETIFYLDSDDEEDHSEIEEVPRPKRTEIELVELV